MLHKRLLARQSQGKSFASTERQKLSHGRLRASFVDLDRVEPQPDRAQSRNDLS